MKHVFSKPYEFEGETYEEFEIDLESLKGSDIAKIKKSWSAAGNFSALPVTDSEFCVMVLAKVTKKPLEFFEELPANEYCQMTQNVTNFLMS